MRFPIILVRRKKIEFKDKQLELYKKLIDEKDEIIREKFIENMSLSGEIYSKTQQLNNYVEFYKDEKNNNEIINKKLKLITKEAESLRTELYKCKYDLREAEEIIKSNKDILEQYEADKYMAMKNLVNKASKGRLKKKREKNLYLELLKSKEKNFF